MEDTTTTNAHPDTPAQNGVSPTLGQQTRLVSVAIGEAQGIPTLIDKLNTIAPAQVQAEEGKALIASKTPWGVLAAFGVAYASTRLGLGWDQNMVAVASGAAVLVGSYGMRYITSAPITGWFRKEL